MPIDRIFAGIQKQLISHGANKIMYDYEGGRASGLSFIIQSQVRMLPIKIPARVNKVEMVLYGTNDLQDKYKEQAYRTAWRNIYDWISAQMALLETQMVQLEEIFLPYIIQKGGQTIFEKLENNQFLLPE